MTLLKTLGDFEVYADRDGAGFFWIILDTQTGWFETADSLAKACNRAVQLSEPLNLDFDPAA